MKNKWKGSWLAKLGAWVGITISGSLFVGSVIGAVAIWDTGAYEMTAEEYQRDAMESAANQYAARALNNLVYLENYEISDTYFRYGIIQAEDIDGMNFNDESIYVERNFTEKVSQEDLFIVSHDVGNGDQYDMYVDAVLYNIEMGVFYYETSEGYFPVQEVKLGYTTNSGRVVYTLSYDYDVDMYRTHSAALLGMDGTVTQSYAETVDATVAEAADDVVAEDETVAEPADDVAAENETVAEPIDDAVAEDTTVAEVADEITEATDLGDLLYYEEADHILQREYVTLDMLDRSDWNYMNWEYLILDGKQYINSAPHVYWVENSSMTDKEITSLRDYELTEDNAIWIPDGEEENTPETYWVVVLLPEEVEFGWSSDLFVQANALATIGYSLRYSIYLIMVIAFAVTIALLVFLLNAAGHRKEEEGIVATWIDRIPFDIYLIIAFFVEIFLFEILVAVSYDMEFMPAYFGFAVVFICMCLVALFSLLTFAVRVKLGKWWRNTIIWRILKGFRDMIRSFVQNISLLWKAMLIMGGLAFFEFIGIYSLVGYLSSGFLLLWLLEKLVLTGVVLAAVLQMQKLKEGGRQLAEGDLEHPIDTEKMFWEFKQHGESLNSISAGMSRAVEERMKSERFKTELITNVSHDIKTPLTSIINYVDLLEKEELNNEQAVEYLEVLERQSGRLKKLIEDLMEASKASTGNLAVSLEKLEAGVSMVQTVGEFEEKTQASGLELMITKPENPVYIMADSRHFWRVIDNLMNNICKYAQPGTRVYINLEQVDQTAVMTFRNTSKYPLNITSEELMERFVRGDSSRNTEGSGLGLSIAQSLMELMDGKFELYVDGDLFKVELKFAVCNPEG